ncbi:MAG TPA: DUF1588 domain-containing protein [Polyangiaceae bacterium]
MRPAAHWLTGLSFVALAAACSAGGGDGIERNPPGADDSTGSGGTTGSTGSGSVSSGTGGGDPRETCGTSQVGAPVLRRLTRDELNRSIETVFPSIAGAYTLALSADDIPEFGFDNEAGRLLVGKQTARQVADTAESAAAAVTANLGSILPCASSTLDATCAGEFLDSYGKRLFRRPLSAEERTRYLDFFSQAASTTDATTSLGWMLRGLLESPHFLYRREIGGAGRELSQYEIATELAYTFSGTAPSDELIGMADRGELASPETLVQTASDLLVNGGYEVLQHFFSLWLRYEAAATLEKINVSDYASVRQDMLEETRRFIDEVVFQNGGGTRELLTSPITTPSTRLASFYGLPAPSADFAPVERPAGQGMGLLAQGSILSTEALSNSSSPTQRSLLVFEGLLCREPPTVPPNVPIIPDPQPGAVTTRQRYEQHRSEEPCKSCHLQFEPIGFAFEHFDEVGRYREDEGGLPIDTSGYVPNGLDERLFEFSSFEELVQGLLAEPVVHNCVSGLLASYAFGVGTSCLGESARAGFASGEIGFAEYFASLAGEPHFTRRAGN